MHVDLQGGPKNLAHFLRLITSSNIHQFSNFFHYQNQENICNNTITKDPTTHQVFDETLRRTKSVPHFWDTLYCG